MTSIDNTRDYVQYLTHLYNLFNKRLWANELPEVMITLLPTKNAYGHFSGYTNWISSSTDSKKYELNIDALSLDNSPEAICATLIHEQCHLYAKTKGIIDTSDNHRYHNKNFKRIAQDHGLEVEHDEKIGWSLTTLDDDTKKYLKRVRLKEFELYRVPNSTTTTKLLRFYCSRCDTVAWVSKRKQPGLICGGCGNKLLFTPPQSKRRKPRRG